MGSALTAGLAIALVSGAAFARPVITDEATFVSPAGHVRVHYTKAGPDAVPLVDADSSNVPDHVERVAGVADGTWAAMVDQGGFRGWLGDGAAGGGPELDLYLHDLSGSDGHFEPETCSGTGCAGWAEVDNDFAGFAYPSLDAGAQAVVSHELFHAIQAAYDQDQVLSWSEGTAVWAEEVAYPAQSDYEGLVSGFQDKPFRPFDREGGGFGDAYPYGTALWATFLEESQGAGTVRDIWERCEDTDGSNPAALAMVAELAMERGTSLAALWIEFTRWNALTGRFAVPGAGYAHAADLPEVYAEAQLDLDTQIEISIEGLSSRVIPLFSSATDELEITVVPVATAPMWAAAVVLADGTFLELVDGAARIPAGASGRLVVTSAQKSTLPWRSKVTLTVAPPLPPPDSGGGGCQVGAQGGGSGAWMIGLALVGLGLRRRRRARPVDQALS